MSDETLVINHVKIEAVQGGFVVDYMVPSEGTYGTPYKRVFTDWDEMIAFLRKGIIGEEAEEVNG